MPLIPQHATIRISGRPAYDPGVDGVAADQLPLWQAIIIWWAHYCRTPHSRKAQTVDRAQSVGFACQLDILELLCYIRFEIIVCK